MSTAVVDFDTRPSTTRPSRSRPVRARTGSEAGGSGVRLTRRGRLVIVLLGLVAAYGGFTLLSDPAVSTSQEHHGSHEQIVVEPGQSLWDIATTIAPDDDPRDVIAEIVDLNALESSGAVQAGQLLYIPGT